MKGSSGVRVCREWVRRCWASVRRRRTDADLEQELRLHLELAAEDGNRIQAGGISQAMDALRDQRGLPWLDALRADVTFGWRQLNRDRGATLAAILSLGLAIGAMSGAFRLVDAILLRPLPVVDPDRLFAVATTFVDAERRSDYDDDFDYPTYLAYSKTVAGHADLMLVGAAFRNSIRFGNDGDPEFAVRQYVSGNFFSTLGLQPVLGRLLTPADDVTPGGHPIAVVSHDFWTRRLARDPEVVGRTFHIGNQVLEIIGVAPKGFTGSEPGSLTDVFVPATMNREALNRPGWSWFRIWLRPKAGVEAEQVRQMLQARFRATHEARLKEFPADTPKERIEAYLREEVRLLAAGSGVSGTQKMFRRPLLVLVSLAAVVLLIACANVANVLIARAMARTREMALRVSIGASRWRLIQLMLIESALLALFASVAGGFFASWAAPLVVSMLSPMERPVQLVLSADLRVLGFGVALALTVTILFGLAPALRASSVKPVGSLKGDEDPRAQSRLTNTLVAAQTAFCVVLLFAASLFLSTFDRLVNRPLGFSHRNVLVMQAESRATHSPELWSQIAGQLRSVPGVESVAFAGWAPLSGNRWRSSVLVNGQVVQRDSPYFLEVSAGYFATMRLPLLNGRDFQGTDGSPFTRQQQSRGVGIVNQTFARTYFGEQNPIGRTVVVRQNKELVPMEIVGIVGDAAYDNVREPMRPTVYVPLEPRSNGAFLVRTAGDPVPMSSVLRHEVLRARGDVDVRSIQPLTGFVRQQMIRERLLATLSGFFGVMALFLAGVGLYGVLNFAVIRQRREFGLRMALGARALDIVERVALRTLGIVCAGTLVGLSAGIGAARIIDSLLFEVKPTDAARLILPVLALAAVAALAALPPAIRAARIDPARTLRSE